MATHEEIRQQLKAAISTARDNYNLLIAEQLEAYPFEDTTNWDRLTADEKVAEWGRKNHAKGLIDIAESNLRKYDAKMNEFYNTLRAGAFSDFEVQVAAQKGVLVDEWQMKEDYARQTGDWELLNYSAVV